MALKSSSWSVKLFTLINHAPYGSLLISAGSSAKSSFTSSIVALTGQNTSDTAFADVESVKAVSDVFCPVSATIEEVNEDLADDPALINSDPYGAWFIKVNNLTDHEELLSAKEYEEYVQTLD